jgi:hypothetical protein
VTSSDPKREQENANLLHVEALPNEELLSTIIHLRERALDDLKRFRARNSWPAHPVKLRLSIVNDDGSRSETDFERLANAFPTFNELHLISSAGTGKTTTLLQIAGALIEHGGPVPLFLPLAEWSNTTGNFFQSVESRAAFASVDKRCFEQLATSGDLLLLLDGWNELSAPQRERAVIQIVALRRDYPNVGIVISTRRQVAPPPLTAPRVEIGPLDAAQQREIAIARRASEGLGLLERASDTGLSDLITIPIYF